MLPVTRANLDHICCICLLDIRPSMLTQKVYCVKEEKNMSKVLKITAHITVLKNPINQKYINDYCRKICEICFLKIQYSYFFREKIMASTAMLKELIESDDLDEIDVKKLQFFCRICLNRQQTLGNDANNFKTKYLNWLKNCSGIRFASLLDAETFRIKEGTNINEIAVIHDKHFPQQLCQTCLKKLQNVEEFRKSATQSFEYMISVMGYRCGKDDGLIKPEIKQLNENVNWEETSQLQAVLANKTQVEENNVILENEHNMNIDEYKQEDTFCLNAHNFKMRRGTLSVIDPIGNFTDYENSTKLENESTIINGLDFTKDLHYSSEDDDNNHDAEFGFNFSDDEISSKVYNGVAIKTGYRINSRGEKVTYRTKQLESVSIIKKENNEGNNNTNNNGNTIKENIVCEDCSKSFSSKKSLRRHHKAMHTPESDQTKYKCKICSKQFKRKTHLDEHVKAVHEKLRPFKCSYCTKTFSANGSRKVHELSHSGNFQFVCKFCEKGFRRSYQLKVHLERHTTNPELLCSICKRSQKTPKDLEDHIKSHEEKRLQCPSCGKLFSRPSHLKDHQNAVHLKLRPFKCEFCDLAFGDRKTRRVHQYSHTEERPITCSVCKRGFKTNCTFKRHINQTGHESEDCSTKNNKTKKNSNKLLDLHYTPNFNNIFEI